MVARGVLAFLIASLVAAPFSISARQAHACSCVAFELEEHVSRADFIIVGTVLEIAEVSTEPNRFPIPYDLTIAVEEYLKGAGSDTITVRDTSSLQGPACSAFDPGAVGRSYLLFLFRSKEGHLGTSSCAGSTVITDQNRDHIQSIAEQIRQILGGTPFATETAAVPVTLASPTVVPTGLPLTGVSDDGSVAGTTTLIAAGVAGAALALSGLGAAIFWRRTPRR